MFHTESLFFGITRRGPDATGGGKVRKKSGEWSVRVDRGNLRFMLEFQVVPSLPLYDTLGDLSVCIKYIPVLCILLWAHVQCT